ncbi:hypothetical protein FA15DRAFT_661740 [Coprinopsis marcescibilis]|uniref:ATP synthase subunit e, mitochondrial n=1 Tax=Coprinopsis marcescibilis TaxID=230819 RepID=A0A5C3KAF2_COPMA|nr:hypothetical protein FA15DRAFT_661740 [Coprinopsis marcescibilis]
MPQHGWFSLAGAIVYARLMPTGTLPMSANGLRYISVSCAVWGVGTGGGAVSAQCKRSLNKQKEQVENQGRAQMEKEIGQWRRQMPVLVTFLLNKEKKHTTTEC